MKLPNKVVAKLALVLVIILGPMAFVASACTEPQVKLSHLKVVTLPYIGFAPFFIAQDENYFAEQALEIEFVKFASATDAIPLLSQGSLDVVAGSISASVFNAMAKNINVKIVASKQLTGYTCATGSLMARKDLYESGELDSLPEIKGKRVAIPALASLNHFSAVQVLETVGLTTKDIQIIKLPPENTLAAFENRSIDAAMVGTPLNEQLKTSGRAVTLESTNRIRPGFQETFVMYGSSLLETNTELGQKFMIAYLKGIRQYLSGKTDRNLQILEKYLAVDRKTLEQTCWNPMEPDAKINIGDISKFQDWVYREGFIDKKLSKEQLIETRFIDYANRILGPTSGQ